MKQTAKTYIAFMDNMPETIYSKKYPSPICFKIGKSNDPKRRLITLKTANPFIKSFKVYDFDCESYLHEELKQYNINKEWFCVPNKYKSIHVKRWIYKYICRERTNQHNKNT
jgi:hypothetical protein